LKQNEAAGTAATSGAWDICPLLTAFSLMILKPAEHMLKMPSMLAIGA